MFTKSLKVTDFTGQNIYVGLDVHLKSWMVSIYSDEFELKTFSQPPDALKLGNYLRQHYPNAHFHLAYEAGFCGFWIHRAFKAQDIECIVIHPGDVPSSDKEQKRKTDGVDSRKIARGLKNNELNAVFVPGEQQEADRMLIRSRGKTVKDLTTVKNRIKAFLKIYGISIPEEFTTGNWTGRFTKWLNQLSFTEPSSKLSLQYYVQQSNFLIAQRKQIEQGIQSLATGSHYGYKVKLLTTIPAVGVLTAMTFLTEIGDITRFKNIDHLSSYCGLTPDCRNSGQTERIIGITRRGNAILKTILIECSWMAIRKDPALLLYYKKLLPRMNGNKAIVKVARKLLNRITYVMRNQQPYVLGVVA
ncbi:IS110 family transposase [Chitinophaga sp.]|uniref:IS110 family transposase n=1 Tax=Chitinophaga sp. TaxID=1869181 RepID=UPI002F91C4F9